MGFQRRLTHMAAVTKWKADQQMRLMRSQNEVRDLERQVEAQKLALADAVLTAHGAGALTEAELTPLCIAIEALKAQIEAAQAAHETIKAEEPPELDAVTGAPVAAPTPAPTAVPEAPEPVQAAIAPVPEATVASPVEIGMPPAEPATVPPPVEIGTPPAEPMVVPPPLEFGTPPAVRAAVAPVAQASGLVCPECGRDLVGRFCPEHGLEGVPKPEAPEAPAAAPEPAERVCPVCGRVLTARFCPEHGVEGVPGG